MKKKIYITLPFVLILISFMVSGKRTNPSVEQDINWPSPEVRERFYLSCADCHSHETKWPWYSRFAPVSWRIIDHVEEGREHFNISTRDMGDADEAAETVQEGEMPLKDYALFHPGARMSTAERQQFARDLRAAFGGETESRYEESDQHDHDDD